MKITWQGVFIGVVTAVTSFLWVPALVLGIVVKVVVIGFKVGYGLLTDD